MYRDLAEFIEENSVSGPRAYALATVGILTASALRVALNPYLGDAAPYSFQVLVILLTSSLAGFGPGVFAVALALGLGWSFLPPYEQPFMQHVMSHSTTALAGIMICVVTATMRSALLSAATARREADFLGREMSHRVKNLFAVVASMTTLSARDRPEAREALGELRARVQALSNAHDVAISETQLGHLPELMDRLVTPYAKPGSGEPRIFLSGEGLDLPFGYTTPLALIFHELATNAVKYGALSTRDGTVHLSWERREDTLDICWKETGVPRADQPAETGEAGFGTVLVEASVAQLRGDLDRSLTDDGLRVRLSIPLAGVDGNAFRSGKARDSQGGWAVSRSSLSALRDSRWFSRTKSVIRDLRS